jgi:hypothetical protein
MLTGTFSLVDQAVTVAGTYTGEEVIDLDGMTSVSFQVRFAYGSVGTSIRVYIQTTLDQKQSWADIACLAFGTASDIKMWGQNKADADGTLLTPTDGALTSNTTVPGILGDSLRAKWVVVGTYATSTVLSARAVVS